jgi:hypothetical protein
MQNHEDEHVGNMGQGDGRHRKYEAKLGLCQAYDLSND